MRSAQMLWPPIATDTSPSMPSMMMPCGWVPVPSQAIRTTRSSAFSAMSRATALSARRVSSRAQITSPAMQAATAVTVGLTSESLPVASP
jgi:hypothetical protein